MPRSRTVRRQVTPARWAARRWSRREVLPELRRGRLSSATRRWTSSTARSSTIRTSAWAPSVSTPEPRRCSTTAWSPTMRPRVRRRRARTAAACGPTRAKLLRINNCTFSNNKASGVAAAAVYVFGEHGRQDQCADQQHHDFGQQRQSRACDPKRRRYLRPRKRQPGDRQFDGLRQPFRKGRRYRGLRQGGQAEQGGDRQLYDCRQHDGDGRKRCGIAAGCRRRGHRGLQYADLGQYDGRRG